MDRHRYVLLVFMVALVILLGMPWWLSHQAWAAMLGRGFTWQKGVVLFAFAGMAAAYFYWLVQLFLWVCAFSSNERRNSHHEEMICLRGAEQRVFLHGTDVFRCVSSDACHSVQKDGP